MDYDDLKSLVMKDVRQVYSGPDLKIAVEATVSAMWKRLGGNDPHRAAVDDEYWTISHPLPCRIQEGGLLACPVRAAGRAVGGPGNYVLVDTVWSKVVD